MKPITIEMKYKKSTKGTHVYEAEDKALAVTSIYIKRGSFSSPDNPKSVTVTIS